MVATVKLSKSWLNLTTKTLKEIIIGTAYYWVSDQSYDDLVQYKGEQIGQTILPDINLIWNSVDDPGCLKKYLAFQRFSVG